MQKIWSYSSMAESPRSGVHIAQTGTKQAYYMH